MTARLILSSFNTSSSSQIRRLELSLLLVPAAIPASGSIGHSVVPDVAGGGPGGAGGVGDSCGVVCGSG